MKRTLLAVLLAAGTLMSAQSFAAGSTPAFVNYGDENNLSSWLYTAPTAKQFPADSGKPASASPVAQYGDENDLSWLYAAPTATQFAESTAPAKTLTAIVHYGDENDTSSWLYTAPTAKSFTTYASTPTAPVR